MGNDAKKGIDNVWKLGEKPVDWEDRYIFSLEHGLTWDALYIIQVSIRQLDKSIWISRNWSGFNLLHNILRVIKTAGLYGIVEGLCGMREENSGKVRTLKSTNIYNMNWERGAVKL